MEWFGWIVLTMNKMYLISFQIPKISCSFTFLQASQVKAYTSQKQVPDFTAYGNVRLLTSFGRQYAEKSVWSSDRHFIAAQSFVHYGMSWMF